MTENNADIVEFGGEFKIPLVKVFMNDYNNPIIKRINYSQDIKPDGRVDILV